MCIVIVDDSTTNLVVLKHLAKANGSVPVCTFSKPEMAKDFLSGNPADLVIVDCEMPGLNGIDFIAAVRRFRHHADTPIVMVTHHSDTEIRTQALTAGATEFLSKPVDASEFKVRIRNLLQLKGRPLVESI